MNLNKDWQEILMKNDKIYNKFLEIKNNLKKANNKIIFPSKEKIFRAFNLTSFDNVKVVIIGQDPYHGENEANGLAFSLNEDVKITPSLRNIFKELKNDLGINKVNKDLSGWARQGVLLVNSILTVEKDKPLSHKNFG